MPAGGVRTIKVKMVGDAKGVVGASAEAEKAVGGFAKGVNRASLAVVAAAIGIGVGLEKIGASFDNVYDTIRQTTGATGKRLEGLQADFKAVARVVPASFADIGTATAQLNARTGLTGKGLQKLAEQEVRLAQITGKDLPTTIDDTTRLLGDWSISTGDQSKALDKLLRASQATGTGIDQISQTVVQFGAPLRQLGFGFDESIVMLGKWRKEGVNTELVLGALKKALGTFAKAGKDPVRALRDFIVQLQKAPSAAKATQLAVQTLGVKTGPDFAAAVREGRFEYKDLLAQVETGTGTIV